MESRAHARAILRPRYRGGMAGRRRHGHGSRSRKGTRGPRHMAAHRTMCPIASHTIAGRRSRARTDTIHARPGPRAQNGTRALSSVLLGRRPLALLAHLGHTLGPHWSRNPSAIVTDRPETRVRHRVRHRTHMMHAPLHHEAIQRRPKTNDRQTGLAIPTLWEHLSISRRINGVALRGGKAGSHIGQRILPRTSSALRGAPLHNRARTLCREIRGTALRPGRTREQAH